MGVHLAASWLGLAQAVASGGAPATWPSLGVALVGLSLLGRSRWPAVFLANLAVQLLPAS